MDKNLLKEVRWAIETLNPYIRFSTLQSKCDWAQKILAPDTQMETLSQLNEYQGLQDKLARQRAIEDACIIACNAMEYYLKKEAIIYEELAKEIGVDKTISIMKSADSLAEFQLKKEALKRD